MTMYPYVIKTQTSKITQPFVFNCQFVSVNGIKMKTKDE